MGNDWRSKPRKPAARRKSSYVGLRLTAEDYARHIAAAEMCRLSLAEYMREALRVFTASVERATE